MSFLINIFKSETKTQKIKRFLGQSERPEKSTWLRAAEWIEASSENVVSSAGKLLDDVETAIEWIKDLKIRNPFY